MADPHHTGPGNTSRSGDLWTVILFLLLLIAGVAVVGLGVVTALEGDGYAVLALGVVAVAIPAAIYPLVRRAGGGGGIGGSEETELLRSINERLLISDQAKHIAYRKKDRDALRHAIIDDLRNQDYDAALVLVDDMAEMYGYREEAEEFREQILDAQAHHNQKLISAALKKIDNICERYDWDAASHEVDRLQRLFPNHPDLHALPSRIDQARTDHKRDIERQFLHAAETGNVDQAIELLKELDKYLTPAEAERYQETARGVIGQKRENLGVRFKLSIHDRDWIEAVAVGEQLIREFPNTKMADEVREMLDVLRERAAGQRAAESGRTA